MIWLFKIGAITAQLCADENGQMRSETLTMKSGERPLEREWDLVCKGRGS